MKLQLELILLTLLDIFPLKTGYCEETACRQEFKSVWKANRRELYLIEGAFF